MRKYLFGLELEMADIDRTKTPPPGCRYSSDFDIINSDGIAIDPTGKSHMRGGEVVTPPGTREEVLDKAMEIYATYPEGTFNHRTVLHCHVSWPELTEDVSAMKRILAYQQVNGMETIKTLWPSDPEALKQMNASARAFYIYDKTIMPDYKFDFCMQATTPQEFRHSYAKTKDGKVNWLHARRYALNMYSIFKHGTIEFRYFYPTKNRDELGYVLDYVAAWIDNALGAKLPIAEFLAANPQWKFATEEHVKYNHRLEMMYQLTNFHTNTREVAEANIAAIIAKRGATP